MRQYANIPIGWLSSLMMVILKVELDFGKTFISHGFYIRLRLLSFCSKFLSEHKNFEAVKLFHWEVDYFFRKEDYFIAGFCSVLKGYVMLL